MTTEEYLIHELAERAGVSIRTIRFYMDEGLLPSPDTRGKFAYFTPDYLARLELIRRLKDRRLSLSEIRETLRRLPAPEVDQLLKMQDNLLDRLPRPPAPVRSTSKPGESALQYISQLRDKQEGSKYQAGLAVPAPSMPVPAPEAPSPAAQPTQASEAGPGMPYAGEAWTRLELAPGIELHIHEPADPVAVDQIQKLIHKARKIFGK